MMESEKNKLIRKENLLYCRMRSIAKETGRNNIDFERARSKWLGVYEVCCDLGLSERITEDEQI